MHENLHKIAIKFPMILSFTGIFLFICIVLISTKQELSIQNLLFVWCSYLLLSAAILIIIFGKKQFTISIIDVLIILSGILITLNYKLITPANAESKYLNIIFIGVSYASLRVIFFHFSKAVNLAFIIIIFCGFIEAILGISQLIELINSKIGLYHISGTFFNPGPYGGYLSVIMSLSVAYIIRYNSLFSIFFHKHQQTLNSWLNQPIVILYILCCFSFIGSFIIFFAVMSRAAILAFGISLLIIIIIERSTKKEISQYIKKNKIKALSILFLSAIFLFGFGYYLYILKIASANGRIFMWKIAHSILMDHPFTGIGLGAYCGEYAKVQAEYFISNPNSKFVSIAGAPEYGFNEFLHIGAEFGILGMILFISILAISIYRLLRMKNIMGYGLISLLIFSFFSYPLSLLPMQILMVIFITVAGSSNKGIEILIIKRKIILSLFSILLLTTCYYGRIYIHKVKVTLQWKLIQSIYRAKYYEQVIKSYEYLYIYLKDNPRFLFEYGHILNKIGQYSASISILNEGAILSSDPMFFNILGSDYKELGLLDKAKENYILAHHILPDRIYPLYLLMKLYEESSQKIKAIEMAKTIVGFNSKVESSATNVMKKEAQRILDRNNEVNSTNIKYPILHLKK